MLLKQGGTMGSIAIDPGGANKNEELHGANYKLNRNRQ